MLSMTIVLVFIMITTSLAFAHIQQQRIQRSQLDLRYLQAKIMAANKLDLFYIALYESPELFHLSPVCTHLDLKNQGLNTQQLITPNKVMVQHELNEPFYLCLVKEAVFNISVVVNYNNTEQLVLQRRLNTTLFPWTWQASAL